MSGDLAILTQSAPPDPDAGNGVNGAAVAPDRVVVPVSVVIPARNEAASLPAVIASVFAGLPAGGEVIVVDGVSDDGTPDLAEAAGARVLRGVGAGRGPQLAAGADEARGRLLLFLHADTRLPPRWAKLVAETLDDPEVALGAFSLRIDGRGRDYRRVEWGIKQRSRNRPRPYGDQAFFVRAEDYHAVGGFPAWPCFEDVRLAEKLVRRGRVVIRPEAVRTSARSWAARGWLQTTVVNWCCTQLYRVGVSPHLIAYGRRWARHRIPLRWFGAKAVPQTEG